MTLAVMVKEPFAFTVTVAATSAQLLPFQNATTRSLAFAPAGIDETEALKIKSRQRRICVCSRNSP